MGRHKGITQIGSEILTPNDQKRLDDAATFINKKQNVVARSLIEIGAYLLENFFDKDPDNVSSRAPRKGVSLRKLADRDDVNLTYASLSNAVKLAVQETVFTDRIFEHLTESHKLLLVHIDNHKEKIAYAEKVEHENLSVRDLRVILTDQKIIEPRGRAAGNEKNPAEKMFESILKPVITIEKMTLHEYDLSQLSDEKVHKVLEKATTARDRLNTLIGTIKSKMSY